MKALGGILLGFGLLFLFLAVTMDTTVAVEYDNGNSLGLPERVNNIGLMNDQSNYTIISLGMILIGVILLIVKNNGAKKTSQSYPLLFQKYKNLAEYDVEKGDFASAIRNYQLSLSHLENGFGTLPEKQETKRQNLIANIKLKLFELTNNL
ncbi:MAG: hypothetical protein A2X19_06050 [Bacteroidetes bacterium GWE2_39_28]|nr:MAG: hypothetical protein A2X19_06050 [Bacteroidetes bacterium GWE2_39_28]OFY12805.1 MAG: hypothetical protein A2X16_00830 [Bacteroidetes bacterium GWF2_39_10]OFZ11027.1 MAG: hypothetical protein A2465_00865 [Bacteroidetes bacterium RIFOXYC2_FULL_39_11]HCT93716.1 hypothetical protein [Rikenellaceae bacterium]